MKKKSPLSSLEEVISGTVKTALELAQEVCQEIEGEIYRLAAKLDIASRADDRAKIEKAIHAKIKKLEEAISELETKALVKATGAANQDARLEVKHSNAYTREILKRVQDANGQNLAAVFTNKMSSSIIDRLRAATVSVIQEASLTGMSLREQKNALREKWEKACSGLGKAEFVDKLGKDWAARDYFTMNIRTNAMRVYNDVLAGDIVTDGGDLAQISRHGDPHCASCFPWEGRIISITGKTKGFPTYEQARNAGCFHPNCTHTLETVNEVVDGDEIALQKAFNRSHTNLAGDGDKMANVYRLDVARKMTLEGMEKADAEMAVKRERLTAALRVGTIRADAAQVVAGLTDKEVETLTNGVKVPVFTLAKKGEASGWNQGSKGGHIILPKTDDLKTPLSKMVQSVIAAQEAEKKSSHAPQTTQSNDQPEPQTADAKETNRALSSQDDAEITRILSNYNGKWKKDGDEEKLRLVFNACPEAYRKQIFASVEAIIPDADTDSADAYFDSVGTTANCILISIERTKTQATIFHECGHAVFHKQIDDRVFDENAAQELVKLAQAEISKWAKESIGDEWKKIVKDYDTPGNMDKICKALGIAPIDSEYSLEKREQITDIFDGLSAAFSGKILTGHPPEYYKRFTLHAPDELCANITMALCSNIELTPFDIQKSKPKTSKEILQEVMPESLKWVNKNLFGI
jgi:hypothetical protein